MAEAVGGPLMPGGGCALHNLHNLLLRHCEEYKTMLHTDPVITTTNSKSLFVASPIAIELPLSFLTS